MLGSGGTFGSHWMSSAKGQRQKATRQVRRSRLPSEWTLFVNFLVSQTLGMFFSCFALNNQARMKLNRCVNHNNLFPSFIPRVETEKTLMKIYNKRNKVNTYYTENDC